MTAGTSSGIKAPYRFTVPAAYAAVSVSEAGASNARLEIGAYASISPMSIDPVSPMKMRAG